MYSCEREHLTYPYRNVCKPDIQGLFARVEFWPQKRRGLLGDDVFRRSGVRKSVCSVLSNARFEHETVTASLRARDVHMMQTTIYRAHGR